MVRLLVILFLIYSSTVFAFNSTFSQKYQKNSVEFILPNGIEGLALSIPMATNTSVAVALPVGHYNDPEDKAGLAHFVEHMLFMGSKKYPEVESYRTFVANHNGENNASTRTRETNFHFSIPSPYTVEALDRFSDFFKDPLFEENFVEAEKISVNNEFQGYFKEDSWRIDRVFNLVIPEQNHPMRKFGVGNKLSLKNVKREDVLKFYSAHYGAQNMKIFIMGPQSKEELVKLVSDSFSSVPRRGDSPIKFTAPQTNFLPKKIKIAAATPGEILNVRFQLPSLQGNDYRAELFYLVYLLNQRHQGSLFSLLVADQLATGASVSVSSNYSEIDFIDIKVNLTDLGKNQLIKIEKMIFSYLSFLQKNALNDKVFENFLQLNSRLLSELELKSSLDEAEKYASSLLSLSALKGENPPNIQEKIQYSRDVIGKYYLIDYLIEKKFNQDKFRELLNVLSPAKSMIAYLHYGQPVTNKEKIDSIWNIAYEESPMPSDEREILENAPVDDRMKLPEPSVYLVDDPKIFVIESDPDLIKVSVSERGQLGLMRSNKYGNLLFYSQFQIVTDQVPRDERSTAILYLSLQPFRRFILDRLNVISNSGQSVIFAFLPNTMMISSALYSEKADVIFRDILQKAYEFKEYLKQMSVEEFSSYQQQLLETISQQNEDEPMRWANRLVSNHLFPGTVNIASLGDIVKGLTRQDLADQWERLFQSFGVKGILYGNFEKDLGMSLFNQIFTTFKPNKTLTEKQINEIDEKYYVEISLNNYSGPRQFIKSLNNKNSLYHEYFELGPRDAKTLALVTLLDKFLPPLYFTELRDRQQLGYMVQSSIIFYRRFLTLQNVIQSSDYSADLLEERSLLFLENLAKNGLESKVSEEALKNIKELVRRGLQQQSVTSKEYFQKLADDFFLPQRDSEDLKKIANQMINELDQATLKDLNTLLKSIVTAIHEKKSITVKINGSQTGL